MPNKRFQQNQHKCPCSLRAVTVTTLLPSERSENYAVAETLRSDTERRANSQFLQHFEPPEMEGGNDAEISQHLDQTGCPPCGFDDEAESRGETDQRRGGGAPTAWTRDNDDTLFHQEIDADEGGRSRI